MVPPLRTFAPGSPPLVRGKEVGSAQVGSAQGITPARAGKRMLGKRGLLVTWDHPRSCGEKFGRFLYISYMSGSPPLVRGKGSMDDYGDAGSRITPARAGKRYLCDALRRKGKDHPRSCGEKLPCMPTSFYGPGSPPLVRGKDPALDQYLQPLRITPARAGKSTFLGRMKEDLLDHPRSCGEKMPLP